MCFLGGRGCTFIGIGLGHQSYFKCAVYAGRKVGRIAALAICDEPVNARCEST